MQAAIRCLVLKWVPTEKISERKSKGGYGFVRVNGERAFVHASAVDSDFEEDTRDLSGKTLVVYSTETTEKGLSVVRAETLKQHQQSLESLREEMEREESKHKKISDRKSELERFVLERGEEIFRTTEINPAKECNTYSQTVIDEDGCQLSLKVLHQVVTVVSIDAKLIVKVSYTATLFARANGKGIPYMEIPFEGLPKREFSFEAEGVHWANDVAKDDPLRSSAIALCEAERLRAEQERYDRQLAGVREGLELAGIADLVDPEEVLKGWPNAGDLFSRVSQQYRESEPMIESLRWFRTRRKKLIEVTLDELSESKFGVTSLKTWYEAPTYDRYADSGGDGMKGPGAYVGGGVKSKREKWATEIVEKVVSADNAAVNRLDLLSLIEEELLTYFKTEDEKILNSPWVKEKDIVLPESKVCYARKCLANWIREWRVEGPKTLWGEWRKPPQVGDPSMVQKAEEIFIRLKASALRKEGVERELAQKAAENAVEEKRLLDIATVRKDWRQMLTWNHRSLQGLHKEAIVLLEKIRVAQQRADNLAGPRLWEREKSLQKESLARVEQEKARFITGNTWGALDSLNLDKE